MAYQYVLTLTLALGLSFNSFSAPVCRNSVKKSLDLNSLFESRSDFDNNWKAWLSEKLAVSDLHLKKFLPEDRNLTRWEFIKKRLAPEVREILNLARPEFFKDSVLPGPLEITRAMISLYIKYRIPKSDWILPGVVLQSKVNVNEFKAFTYESLFKEWPKDYQLFNGLIPEIEFSRALNNGVMPLQYKTDIHEKFKMHMFYHDIHHLGSFLNKSYLNLFRYYYRESFERIKQRPNMERPEDFFESIGAYDFIEEFWTVPSTKTQKLNSLLKHFNTKNGKPLDYLKKMDIRELQYNFSLNRSPYVRIQEIEAKAQKLKEKVKLAALNEYNPVREWPQELQNERLEIISEFEQAVKPLLDLVGKIQEFYELDIHPIGATVSDRISYRAEYYTFTQDYNRDIAFLRYELGDNFSRMLRVDWSSIDRNFENLIIPLIYRLQLTPEATKEELDRKLKSIN